VHLLQSWRRWFVPKRRGTNRRSRLHLDLILIIIIKITKFKAKVSATQEMNAHR